MPAGTELGALLRRHPVDARRRRRRVVVLIVAGLVLLAVAVFAFVSILMAPGPGRRSVVFLAALAAAGAVALGLGVVRAREVLARGGQAFELYERGLVHRVGPRALALRWDEIEVLDVRSTGADDRISRGLGTDVYAMLRTGRGKVLRIDAFVEDGAELIRDLETVVARGYVVGRGGRAFLQAVRALLILLVLGVLVLNVLALVLRSPELLIFAGVADLFALGAWVTIRES